MTVSTAVLDGKHGSREREMSKHSVLLSQEENQAVASLVGPRCVSLATTVAQVYRSEGPSHNYRWNKRTCGVICFVKDNLRRSYFIRVYDMDRMVLVFDQEIYNQFRYVKLQLQKYYLFIFVIVDTKLRGRISTLLKAMTHKLD